METVLLIIREQEANLISPSYSTRISALVVVADGRSSREAVVEHGLVLHAATPAALVAVRVWLVVMHHPPAIVPS